MSFRSPEQAMDQARGQRRVRAVKFTLTCNDGSFKEVVCLNCYGELGGALSSSNPIQGQLLSWLRMLDGHLDPGIVTDIKMEFDYFASSEECPWDLSDADYGQPKVKKEVKSAGPEMITFLLVELRPGSQPGWYEAVPNWAEEGADKRLYNSTGGHCYLLDDSRVLLEVEAETWDQMFKLPAVREQNQRIASEFILSKDPNCAQGWVDPKGRWFGVAYGAHELFLDFYFGLTEPEAMAQGYQRVQTMDGRTFATNRVKPTKRQVDTMLDHGCDVRAFLED